MPKQVIYKEALGIKTREILGSLSLEQASIRTNLAAETIRKMKLGKVPEPATLRAFAEGFADRGADLHELLVIAGYEPARPEERAVEDIAEMLVARRSNMPIEYGREIARKYIERILADEAMEHINGEPEL